MTTDGQGMLFSAGMTLEELHRLCATAAASFREAHKFTVESHEHSHKVVVWLGGLMGAGIISVHGVFSTAPPIMRMTVLLPWVAGILCAMLTGLLGGETANRNNGHYFGRISLLELLQLEADRELILTNLPHAIDAAVIAKEPASIALNRWLVATNAVFYLAHVFFMVGAVAAVTTMMVLGR